jgi:uncharacterized protein YjiS (DUF1127 family)
MRICSTAPNTAHFVDPTIPGLSGRDLIDKASKAVETRYAALTKSYAAWRADYLLRKDLAGLDARLLRDIGLDRSAS